jgi:hypothetical protein
VVVAAIADADIAVEAQNDRNFVDTFAAVDRDYESASCCSPLSVGCNCIAFDIDNSAAAAAAAGNYRNLPAESCTSELVAFQRIVFTKEFQGRGIFGIVRKVKFYNSKLQLTMQQRYSLVGFGLGGRVTRGEILTSSGDGSRLALAS